ncbi:MAG: BamA/TamA family outer membrane protein [Acidobacteria bacterium]|nr:BamA/TamA family outer membrane protein [Acidobacteriota bacterium]
MRSLAAWLFPLLLLSAPLAADEASRAQEIQVARQKKAGELEPDETSKPERVLVAIKDRRLVERFTSGVAGFRLKLGGLVSGSGFAVGPEYLRRDLADGGFVLRTSASVSAKRYQLYDLQFTFPKLAGGRMFADVYSVHRNYPRIDYYGPGPDSHKAGRSDYRLEDTAFDGTAGVRPLRHLSLGGTLGYLMVNVGPGADPRFVSTEQIFPPAVTPGIDRQSNFLRGCLFAQYDYRDNPGGPRDGGNYVFRYTWNADREFSLYSFRRMDMEVQQYISFFNRRRVIALRGKSVLTDTDAGQTVPFYLQPTLGGSDDLRGFRPFRFYDDNLIVFNGEYRWESFSGLDMALFADAGKVFHRRADWNLKNLEASAGFGFRFNVRNNVFMRLDVGFSHEGFQLWLKFNNVF